MDWLARLIGGFYVFGGIMVLRHSPMDRLMDATLAALTGEATPANERTKSKMLFNGALLTLASGLGLFSLSRWAFPLFVVNTLFQAVYLLWAHTAMPAADAEDAEGRRQTRNAFFIYVIATGFVFYAARRGLLHAWPVFPAGWRGLASEITIISGLTGAAAWWFLRQGKLPSNHAPGEESADTPPGEDAPAAVPLRRLRLAPEIGCSPLWDDESGDNLELTDVALPSDLITRLEQWDQIFQATYNPAEPAQGSCFSSPETRASYLEEARDIARELKEVWPGEVIVRLPENT